MNHLHSLKKRSEFVAVSTLGGSVPTKGLVLQWLKKESSETADMINVGFTATRRIGGAVVRNRVKRRLRALVRDIFPDRAPAGYDFVLIGRVATVNRPYDALVKDVKYALHQVKESS